MGLLKQLKQLLSDIQGWFFRLTERERVMVGAAGGLAGAFLIFLVLFSFSSSAATHRKRTADKLLQLQQAQALAASFRDQERARQEVERQLTGSSVSLISFIEEKGTAAGLELPPMNPKGEVTLGDGRIVENAVELTLSDVNLRSLHSFLTSLEDGPGVVKVKYLRIEPRPANQTLTAWATIATYRLKQ